MGAPWYGEWRIPLSDGVLATLTFEGEPTQADVAELIRDLAFIEDAFPPADEVTT